MAKFCLKRKQSDLFLNSRGAFTGIVFTESFYRMTVSQLDRAYKRKKTSVLFSKEELSPLQISFRLEQFLGALKVEINFWRVKFSILSDSKLFIHYLFSLFKVNSSYAISLPLSKA